ncbi:retrotransposon protein, putative, ty1-copia subclass [Tanacetum coccineum]
MGKTVGELHAMLIEYEKGLPKKAETPQVMMIKGGKIQKANKKSLKVKGKGKANGKGKDKQVYIPKPKNPKRSAKGFREARKLKQGALYLCVGNGVRAGVVLVYRLVENGFVQRFTDFGISVSKNNVHYFNVIPSNEGKMTRKSFPHRPERETDLLGIIHTDVYRGGEYISQEFKDYLKACGIVQQLTPPYTPQTQGGVLKGEIVDKTPYELWYGKVPNLSYLKVWGCEALVKQDTPDKLQQRSVKCIFIGYPKETMGYYFYFPGENKIVVARSERTRQPPNHLCLNVEAEEHSLGDLNEPTSYKAAMLDSKSNKWIDAMNAELQSKMDNIVNKARGAQIHWGSLFGKITPSDIQHSAATQIWGCYTSVRSKLQLADATRIHNLSDAEIYAGLATLGYVTEGKLTYQLENIQELLLKLINDLQILNGIQLRQEELAAKVSSQY